MPDPQSYDYAGPDRRGSHIVTLTDEQMEALVERVAARVTARFYENVGKNVLARALIYIGMAGVGFAAAKGWFRIGS